jgi:intein/homing endonuclease
LNRIQPTKKGPDSILAGIQILQEYQMLITKRSINLKKELETYSWKKDKDGQTTNIPEDINNHCFVGDTLITTINGDIPIKDIKVGDMVLTSKGWRPVLKKFNNGVRQVFNYSLHLDTSVIHLCSTNNHKIKTTEKWKEIQTLTKGNKLFLLKNSTGKPTTYIQEKDTTVKAVIDYTEMSGNSIMDQSQKVITYTTLTTTQVITELKTLILLAKRYILDSQVNKGLKKIQNGLKNFGVKVLKQLNLGTNHQKELNGTKYTEKKLGKQENIKLIDVKSVKKNFHQDIQVSSNIVIKTAKLQHLEEGESWNEMVYDLMVDDCHEYFANGILVHNCVDATRYLALMKLGKKPKPSFKIYASPM